MKRLIMRWLIATSFLLLFAIVLDAQVKGTVTSYSDGVPLIGVSIAVKGTSIGTITDIDGQYDINAGANDILVFTYLGFTSIEESINGRSIIDAALKEDVKTLEEVIVTGYGTQIKRELTGNIAKIKAADFKDIPVSSLEGVLQGKAAGVQINAGTGKLGQAMQIR
ncbi:MAG: carboxypeptidase-like regulatory domain-containing protein, partial [Saprospiraceae bacterium]